MTLKFWCSEMRVRQVLILVGVLFQISCVAQVNLDSLWSVWNTSSNDDTLRFNALNQIIKDNYLYRRPDSALILSKELTALAKLIPDQSYQIGAYSAEGVAHFYSNSFDSAMANYEIAAELAESKMDTVRLMGVLNKMAVTERILGRYDEALETFHSCLEFAKQIGDSEAQSSNANGIGLIYMDRGQHGLATEFISMSLKIDEEIGDSAGMAISMFNLGLINLNLREFEKAKEHFRPSLRLFQSLNHEKGLSACFIGMGDVHRNLKEYDDAVEFFQLAYDNRKSSSDSEGMASSLTNIGNVFWEKGNLKESIRYYQEALDLRRPLGNPKQTASSHTNLGIAYMDLGRWNLAKWHGDTALEIAKSIGSINELRDAYMILSNAYKGLGNYGKALELYELHIEMRDSIMSEDNQREVIRQEYKYDYEKKSLADSLEFAQQQALKDVELEKQELSISRQRIALASSGIGLALIIALSFSIYKGKQRAERAERHKEQFLANMSHEIRTPMHAISGMTKILQRSEPKEKQKRYLNAISESAGNLLVILNDILDLSKVEEGKLNVEQIPTDPKHITQNVVGMLRTKADEKGVGLSYNVDDDVPQLVQGDPTRLNQILLNLVGNAIKFTEKGSVDVAVTVNGDNLRYSVKDTGIGIPKDKLEGVFASFEQVDASTTRKFGGTGLGLSITQKLVELQGGRIWAESELGNGSTFHFELPLIPTSEEVTSQELNDEQLIAMGTALGNVRILLAEDDDFNVMVATDDLEYYLPDSIVEVARNGEQAVEQYQNSEYDLVLMDIHMPRMGGLDAAEQIRELEKKKSSPSTPIIAMTASLLKEELDRCYAAGMNSYIPKPYRPGDMVSCIRNQLVS